jgi:hypothetical protein
MQCIIRLRITHADAGFTDALPFIMGPMPTTSWRRTVPALLRLFHANPVAADLPGIQLPDSHPGLPRTGHYSETEPPGSPCHFVHHQLAVLHSRVFLEQGQQLRLCGFTRQIAHQNLHDCAIDALKRLA